MKSLPKGVKVSPSGDAESLNELSDGFATAISAGLMMVYAVLVLLFGTFLQPITILFSLPLSIGGAIMALLLTGKQLTTPVWIGILMLMGIVTKNAIMLVEFAVEAIRDGTRARPRDHRRRHEARAPDHHDDHRDGRRHDAVRAGIRRRRRIPLADGAGGDRRSGILDGVVADLRGPAMFMMMDDLGELSSGASARRLLASQRRERARRTTRPITAVPPAKGPPSAPPALCHPRRPEGAALTTAPPLTSGRVPICPISPIHVSHVDQNIL